MGRGRRVDKAKLAAAAIVAFNREGTVPVATAARVSALPAVSKPAARPIETIQVGQRVLARNPEVTSAQRAAIQEPVWEGWLQFSLVMPVGELPSDPNQPPAILSIEILRPESWLQDEIGFELTESADFASVAYAPLQSSQSDASLELEANVDDSAADSPLVPLSPLRPIFRDIALATLLAEESGYEVAALTVDMNLPEMGAVGLAVITNIQPCPAIELAEGEVVTATFAHPPTHQVLDVSFEGEAKPIGVTCNHPFWSADRQCFLPIGEMAVGDRVITYAGATKRIESLLPRPGPETVFNLEVYGEHVYYVGSSGILVHNNYLEQIRRFKGGSRQVRSGDADWHLPSGMGDANIPRADSLGDRLQDAARKAAKKWKNAKGFYTENEAKAIKDAAAKKDWRSYNLLKGQARGRYVENELRSQFPELNWQRRGVDIPNQGGINYEILSGTKGNIRTHAYRMSDLMFRMITS